MQAKGQIWSQLAEEVVILNLSNSNYYGLNPVGASVWELLKQPATLASLEQKITEEYAVAPETARDDLTKLLKRMIEENLIEPC